MRIHSNSKKNDLPHHLYEILDTEDDTVFKYGISCEAIGEDGLSSRIREQLDLANLISGLIVGSSRFVARIVLLDIPGREKALEIEDEFIHSFFERTGHFPPGNRNKKPR